MSAAKELVEQDAAVGRWNGFLKSVAAGAKLEDAMLEYRVTRADLDAAVLNPAESQRFEDAQLSGVRRGWPILHIEDVCRRIASGLEVGQALIEVRGFEDLSFLELVAHDPDVHRRFMSAQQVKSFRDAEQLLRIANDDSKDTLDTVKGPIPNQAAVGRSKLKWEALRFNMQAYHPKLFGEKKDSVQVNVQINHAEVLELARTREKLRDKGVPKITRQVIDAAFTSAEPVPAVEPHAVADQMRAAAVAECSTVTESEPAGNFGLDD